MFKNTAKIEGMMCSMCEAHIADAIRNAFPKAKKVKASKAKGEVSFISESEVSGEQVRAAIEPTGYGFTGFLSVPYKKKSFFK